LYSEEYSTRIEALSAEKKIQKWGRKKKEPLISGDWGKLSYYAKQKSK
jgi:predicted GIY-YIG superfamily endonuclease